MVVERSQEALTQRAPELSKPDGHVIALKRPRDFLRRAVRTTLSLRLLLLPCRWRQLPTLRQQSLSEPTQDSRTISWLHMSQPQRRGPHFLHTATEERKMRREKTAARCPEEELGRCVSLFLCYGLSIADYCCRCRRWCRCAPRALIPRPGCSRPSCLRRIQPSSAC